jgi:hypothetical protein
VLQEGTLPPESQLDPLEGPLPDVAVETLPLVDGPAAIHLAHAALLEALPAHALNLELHQQQYDLGGGAVPIDELEQLRQAEAIQVALQQQQLLLSQQQQQEQQQ